MSLFDVLKYPLSNPPTLKELSELPIEILQHLDRKYYTQYDKMKDSKIRQGVIDSWDINKIPVEEIRKNLAEYDDTKYNSI